MKLLNSDLNIIKSSGTFASNSSNTYISFTPDFVSDYGDNPVYGISSDDGARVVSYTNDTSPPTIASFVLDFNNSTVTIRFDEPINQSTPMLSDIVFQNSAESDSDEVSLSSSTLTVVDEFTIVIQVNNSDLNNLKLLPDFGLENSTFVNISSSDITDIYGNQFTDQVLGATTIVVDTLPPLLTAFSLDLGARELLLTFNEVVNSSTIDATKILLINSAVGPSEMVRLSAASVSESDNGQVVAIDLSSADLIALNMFMNLGTNITNTFIQLSSGVVLDIFGNENLPVLMAEMADQLFVDMSQPIITAFDLNLSNDTLTLRFSEPVNPSTFDPTGITLQNHFSNATYSLTLSGGNVSTAVSDTITVRLTQEDLIILKTSNEIGLLPNETYLSAEAGLVRDLYGVNSTVISASAAQRVTFLIADKTPPVIVSFDISLVNSSITIFFNEPVTASSVDVTAITLQNRVSNATVELTLSGSTGPPIQDTNISVTINFAIGDLTQLLTLRNLCSNKTNCFLNADDAFITDVAGNDYTVDPDNLNILPVSTLSTDTTPPELTSFVLLDLDEGILRLNFTEPVNASSVNFNQLVLFYDPITETEAYTLTGGSASLSGASLDIKLTTADTNYLKSNTLCNVPTICWIRITQNFVRDVTDNRVLPASPASFSDSNLRAGQIIQDTSPPEVLNFNLDFNNNTLVIEFNEAVNPATFDPTGLIFTSGINSSSTYSVLAGEATRLTTAQSTTLEISLTDAVSNKIRSTCDNDTDISTCIGASQNTTFLSFGSGLINDITGRSFVASTEPLQVSTLEEDVTPPQIATFLDLNLETFQITVEFSEPVQLPVNLSLFTLHSAATGGINISLSEGQSIYANPADKTRVTFTLSNEDVVAIKTNINIGTALANTFLSALADAAEDFSDLLSASSSALRTTNVESDTLQPSLVNFSLDLDSGEIFFTFNDVINTMSLVPNRLTLKSSLADTFTNNSYTLTGGASPGPDDFTFTFRLSSTDLNAIKSRKALAAMSGVFDVSGLPIVPVSGFIADLVTPDKVCGHT